ncbi:hypothetical protein M758_4G105000 [Ceratodon purpureus]|nr:hypothetical protein M758_4G105000 [Ceratodon purpureus]
MPADHRQFLTMWSYGNEMLLLRITITEFRYCHGTAMYLMVFTVAASGSKCGSFS